MTFYRFSSSIMLVLPSATLLLGQLRQISLELLLEPHLLLWNAVWQCFRPRYVSHRGIAALARNLGCFLGRYFFWRLLHGLLTQFLIWLLLFNLLLLRVSLDLPSLSKTFTDHFWHVCTASITFLIKFLSKALAMVLGVTSFASDDLRIILL